MRVVYDARIHSDAHRLTNEPAADSTQPIQRGLLDYTVNQLQQVHREINHI